MSQHKKLFIISIAVTLATIIWTICLLFWDINSWFGQNWIKNMWLSYDIILIVFLVFLTCAIFNKNNLVSFLSPTFFGMILADWIISFLMWYFLGFNLLSIQFILMFLIAVIMLIFFFWFFNKLNIEATKW